MLLLIALSACSLLFSNLLIKRRPPQYSDLPAKHYDCSCTNIPDLALILCKLTQKHGTRTSLFCVAVERNCIHVGVWPKE